MECTEYVINFSVAILTGNGTLLNIFLNSIIFGCLEVREC